MSILDSERNEECIDITMMCVFFMTVFMILIRRKARILNIKEGFRLQIYLIPNFI